jgi:hypothetical protein
VWGVAEHEPHRDPVRVLFVAGTGRSGSTLLATILGQVPGVVAAGELRFLWQRGAVQDERCGCGRPFSACPQWSSVMSDVVPDGSVRDVAQAVAARLRHRTRARRVPQVLLRRVVGLTPLPSHPDDATLVGLYRALRERTGADVVVDSSKLPLYGLLLQELPGVEVTVLHLVRDPRAAAYSWLRTRASRQRDDDPPMDRQPVLKSATLWLLWNLVAALVWRQRDGRHLRLRYEALVRDPSAALAPVLERLGAPAGSLPFVDRSTLRIAPTHAVAGNPSRHVTGHVEVRDDTEWRGGLSAGRSALVQALTAPTRAVLGWSDRRATGRATGRATQLTAVPVVDAVDVELAVLDLDAADEPAAVGSQRPAGPPG